MNRGGRPRLGRARSEINAARLRYSDGLGLYAMRRDAATYQWARVAEIGPQLMLDVFCTTCDALSNVADVAAVGRTLFVLLDDLPARALLAIDVDSGAKLAEHKLPGDHEEWEGVHLERIEGSSTEFRCFLARDHPPEIWSLRYSLVDGFACAA